MKKLLKRLTPNALRRIDDYLLRNYPTVWRTRIHIVLPLAVLAFVLLFAAGYFLPKNTFLEPLVDPIAPLEITQGNYYLIPFVFAVIAVLYWGFTQYQYKFDEVKPFKVITILLIYGIGLFVILGLDTTAFRLGTIAKATQLMCDKDLELVESKDYFLYGFIPKDSIKTGEENTFFEQDTIFRYAYKHEDNILLNRYNFSYLSYITHLLYQSEVSNISNDWSYQAHMSFLIDMSDSTELLYHFYNFDSPYLSELSSLSDELSSLDASYESYRTYRSYRGHLSCESYLENRSYLSNLSEPLHDRLNRSSLSYHPTHLFDIILKTNFYDSRLFSSYDDYYIRKDSSDKNRIRAKYGLADYDTFYIGAYVRERIDAIQFELERLREGNEDVIAISPSEDDIIAGIDALKEKLDTVKAVTPELNFYLPFWFYQLEDGVRSIRHAEQYFKQRIICRYLKMALSYLPFVLMLFFMFPFLSRKTFLGMLLLVVVFIFLGKEKFLSHRVMNMCMLSLLMAFVMPFFNRDKKGLIDSFLHLFVVTAMFVVVIPFFIENRNEYMEALLPKSFEPYFNQDFIYYPKTWVFYLTAAMCLIAPVLFTYLKGLPKSR